MRLLRGLREEDFTWRPDDRIPSAQAILSGTLAEEELQIHRRLRGKTMLTDDLLRAAQTSTGLELLALLNRQKRSTDRFLRSVLRGEQVARSSHLFKILEKLVARETEMNGQIRLLQTMRRNAPLERIEPGSVSDPSGQQPKFLQTKGARP